MAPFSSSTITTGILIEEQTFQWKIENYELVPMSDAFTAAQNFEFKAGSSIDLPTTWSCFLQQSGVNTNRKFVGIFLQLLKKPKDAEEVNVSFDVEIKHLSDPSVSYVSKSAPFKNMVDKSSGYGFSNLIAEDGSPPLADGTLTIDITFKLFATKPASVDLPSKVKAFESKSLQLLSQELGELETVAGAGADSTTKIYSKDNVEFPVNRGVLSARSTVFKLMFETKMKKEGETDHVRIDGELSSKTVNVLLRYIQTGTLHKDWKGSRVIKELAYAARKYKLSLLVEFLDDVLGSMCKVGRNASKLLLLANKLGMKRAEAELFAFVRNNAASVDDITVFMERDPEQGGGEKPSNNNALL